VHWYLRVNNSPEFNQDNLFNISVSLTSKFFAINYRLNIAKPGYYIKVLQYLQISNSPITPDN